ESFTTDGLEFLNDNGSPLEGNVCLGVWAINGRQVRVNHPSWNYDANGNLIGTVSIRSLITVDQSGNTFKGTLNVVVYDLNGHTTDSYSGQLTGQRISAQ
ncbi:MAG: hypothetical protein JO022_03160, partial [Acidobacteriaceae bacterium]|nr:hypothetical protein [Acidobacteriaceae bacterium]